MIIHLPEDLASSIRAEVRKGKFASEDEAVAAAVRDYLRRSHAQASRAIDAGDTSCPRKAEGQPSSQELQLRLFEAGIVSEIKPPIADLRPYENRKAVPITGEPISETIIRERR